MPLLFRNGSSVSALDGYPYTYSWCEQHKQSCCQHSQQTISVNPNPVMMVVGAAPIGAPIKQPPTGCFSFVVSKMLATVLLVFESAMVVLFVLKGVYADPAKARLGSLALQPGGADMPQYYTMFQGINVMIFIGFGFLMTFLKNYGYGAVGFNMLVAALTIQWAAIMRSVIYQQFTQIDVGVAELIQGEFAAAAVLITFGAVLGKTGPVQLILLTIIEVVLYVGNDYIGTNLLQASDMGGSISIHVFGAYFGLACARTFHRKAQYGNPKEGSVYHSDLFSMIGTVFLWMYWPSFNGAMAVGDSQSRAVVNTFVSISTSCITAFATSAFCNNGKLNMVHIQNATLAGGVAVGTCADMVLQPAGAIGIGALAGVLSVIGYQYLQPWLLRSIHLHDTCGVHNLHGMPGVVAGLVSILAAGLASSEFYGNSLYTVFPARAPGGLNRSAQGQALIQAAALGITLAIALVGGVLTGLFLRIPLFGPPTANELFDDRDFWNMPLAGVPAVAGDVPCEDD